MGISAVNAAADLERRIGAGDPDRARKVSGRDHVLRDLGDLLHRLLEPLEALLQRLGNGGIGGLILHLLEPVVDRQQQLVELVDPLLLLLDEQLLIFDLPLLHLDQAQQLLEGRRSVLHRPLVVRILGLLAAGGRSLSLWCFGVVPGHRSDQPE
jgi:hypothetical protein